jgi:hypothetical protein
MRLFRDVVVKSAITKQCSRFTMQVCMRMLACGGERSLHRTFLRASRLQYSGSLGLAALRVRPFYC